MSTNVSAEKKIIGVADATYQDKSGQTRIGVRLYLVEPYNGVCGLKALDVYLANRTYDEFKDKVGSKYKAVIYEPTPSGKARAIDLLYD